MRRGINIQKTAAFTGNVRSRFRSRIAGGRVLLLGVFLTVLALSAGLVLSDSVEHVSAQDAVMVHEATITVGHSPDFENIYGYSDFSGTIEGKFELESEIGSIDNANFKYSGTEYEIQRIFLNRRFDSLILKTDPLFNVSTQGRPSVTIGDETYSGEDSWLALEHYSWLDVGLEWQDGNSIPFTLSLTTVSSSDTDAQANADGVPANIIASLTESGEERGGGFSGLMAWLAGAGAVALASIGYVAYRVLR